MYFDDLADDELAARLTGRGCPPDLAEYLAGHRDDPDEAAAIAQVLDR